MAKKTRIIQHSEECPELHHPENDEQYTGLQVNSGVEQPPIVNPYLKRKRKPQLTPAEYVEGIRKGNRAVLGQAVTLVESRNAEHQIIAQEVIEKCLPYTGNSRRIGITGVPGAGKSTSIDSFGMHVIKQGHKLAVLAIDPSSERSKGSILGDKTRMERLAVEPDVFIRPSPSAGSLGGVARKTRETIVLCEAAGYDTIFVETVGVGQSEIAVHSMVDYFLLIQLAGTGDELQGIKRGIMEMADGIVICRASSAASWRWPTASSSTSVTATTSSAPNWLRRSSAMPSIFIPSPPAASCPKSSPTRATMTWTSTRCGT